MRKIKIFLSLFFFLASVGIFTAQERTSLTQTTLSASEAASHIGEKAIVCGKVVDTRYASSSRGRPTFLNLDRPYPNQVFTIVIWGEDRNKFGEPEEKYRDKQICVTGIISSYRGVPQIQVSDPKQIQIKEKQQIYFSFLSKIEFSSSIRNFMIQRLNIRKKIVHIYEFHGFKRNSNMGRLDYGIDV